jgi:zinc transporter ZupT
MPSLLLLSFATLFFGPIVLQLAVHSKETIRFIDAFVLCSILGIVIFHIMPESLHHGGLFAASAAVAGFFAPVLAGRFLKRGNCHLHHSLLSLASLGLLAHALLDGMALFGASHDSTGANFVLGLAVILHRLPEGMGIWRLMQGGRSKFWPTLVLVLVALATSIGFYFGESIVVYSNEQTLAVFEGLMAGVLLHVIFHRHHLDELDVAQAYRRKISRIATSLGALCGVALVIGLFVTQPNEHSHAIPHVRVADGIHP